MKEKQTNLNVHPIIVMLVALRHQQGMTQKDLAQISGFTRQTLANWETGGGGGPSLNAIQILAECLGYRVTLEKI